MNTTKQQSAAKAPYTGDIPNTAIAFTSFTAKPFMLIGVLSVIGIVLAQVAGSMQSFIIGKFVDTLLAAPDTVAQLEVVYTWSFIFVGLLLTIYIGWRTAGYAGAYTIIRQNAYSAEVLYEHTAKHSHTYFSDNFSGSISNKIAHAADGSSQMLMSTMFDVFRHTTSILVSGILLAVVHIYLAAGFFAVIAISLVINYFLVQKRRPLVEQYSESTTVLRGQVIDVLTNIQATRQYTNFSREKQNIFDYISDRAVKDRKQWNFAQHINVVNNVMALMLTAGVMVATYKLLAAGSVTPGDVILVMMASFSSSYSMLSIGEIFNRLMRFFGETQEGLDGLLIDHEIVDTADAGTLKTVGGEIAWNNVQFVFGENKVFDNFDLTIMPGQRVGLVGPSGAGKTTFVSLLLRQHDIHGGAIEIDGQNISQVTQDSLRENIAVVPQEPLLFHRSIRENIAYGKPDATDEEIIAVAQKAQAHDFIMQLETGYDTLVGERGIKLSGGQKQRVAIARAMLKDAPILVLDEATSALDSESEVEIQKALHILMEGKTVIAVAHRLSTLREMDRILVLETGKIVEDGSHDVLTKSKGTYQRLWEHQAGGFITE
ncbi:MAG: ATP-binding cassette subfamily B protein [Patiriisocius sp.]|jgi:ATP-binding cassette subfamily B protein